METQLTKRVSAADSTKVYQSLRKSATRPTSNRSSSTYDTHDAMSREKRAASDSFGTSQLVKRAKSDANLNGSSAVAVASGTGKKGALIQAVCPPPSEPDGARLLKIMILTGVTGPARRRAPVPSHGVDRAFWRDLCSAFRSHRPIHCFRVYGSLHMSVCR